MLSRHSAARLLVLSAGSLRSFRPTSLLRRKFASSAPLKQVASTTNGSAQQPPRNAVDSSQKERDTEKTSRPRVVRAKPHYINPLKPQVSIRTKNGRELTFNLDLTPKANVEKLTEAVKSLCSWPADYSQGPTYTVGQPQWSLTKNGDGVFRLLAVKSSKEGDEITSRIQKVADEMNHHPTVVSLEPEGSHTPLHMCVINTTHQPRGLSMRDIRLALAVDSILQDYDVERPISDTSHEQAGAILRRANNRIRTRIYKVIQDTVAKLQQPLMLPTLIPKPLTPMQDNLSASQEFETNAARLVDKQPMPRDPMPATPRPWRTHQGTIGGKADYSFHETNKTKSDAVLP